MALARATEKFGWYEFYQAQVAVAIERQVR
jgi:hypothetical protein